MKKHTEGEIVDIRVTGSRTSAHDNHLQGNMLSETDERDEIYTLVYCVDGKPYRVEDKLPYGLKDKYFEYTRPTQPVDIVYDDRHPEKGRLYMPHKIVKRRYAIGIAVAGIASVFAIALLIYIMTALRST